MGAVLASPNPFCPEAPLDAELRREKLDDIVPFVAHAMDLNRTERYAEAKLLLLDAWTEAQLYGVRSGLIAWQIAVSLDGLGVYEKALEWIDRAMALDPFPAPFRNSREIILKHVRAAQPKAEA